MLRGQLKIVILTFLVGIGVAITYYLFEAAVSNSISYIWNDLFDTENQRWIVIPLCLVLTLMYFGIQHLLDPKAEKQIDSGLGEAPGPTVKNYIDILLIGFLSLIAGASLGPEAVLVPACLVLGGFVGQKFVGSDKKSVGFFMILGFVALIAAFFNSFIVGMLSLLMVKKRFKAKIDFRLILLAAVACAGTIVTLGVLEGSAYLDLPDYTWSIDLTSLHFLILLVLAGYATTYLLGAVFQLGQRVSKRVLESKWWVRSLVAATGLSLLYLLGGSLVQFTGNESIKPMFHEAAGLGLWGLIWLLLIKVLAIGWSKSIGYRGGLVFPSIFVASILVAIAQLQNNDLNLIYGLIAVLIGLLWADNKVKVLL